MSKVHSGTITDIQFAANLHEVKTPVNFQIGNKVELMGSGYARKGHHNVLSGSLDAEKKKLLLKRGEQKAAPSIHTNANRSNQIFNIQNKDTFNMLLN